MTIDKPVQVLVKETGRKKIKNTQRDDRRQEKESESAVECNRQVGITAAVNAQCTAGIDVIKRREERRERERNRQVAASVNVKPGSLGAFAHAVNAHVLLPDHIT